MDKKQKANLLRSRAMMGNQNARKKRATEPDASGVTTAASATAPTSTDAPTHDRVPTVYPRYVAPLPDRCPVIAIGGGYWARCERGQDHEGNHDAVVWFPV